jgi:hypothetical protein
LSPDAINSVKTIITLAERLRGYHLEKNFRKLMAKNNVAASWYTR